LQAPRSRKARLGVRLMRLASEGLFPQLVVIPLHRDHGVITMAAGKNDVIKLLPPLTLSEAEAQEFLEALDTVLTDCEGGGKNWKVVRGIATSTLRRREQEPASEQGLGQEPARRSQSGSVLTGGRIDGSREDACLVTGASGFIGGHLVQRLVRDGYQVRCLVRSSSDTSLLDALEVELAVGDLTDAGSLARAVHGCRYVLHCGAMVSDWARPQEVRQVNVAGTRNLLAAAADSGTVRRFVHFSSTDIYGHPGAHLVEESYAATGFSNWYGQTKLGAESEVRRAAHERDLDTVILRPSTVYGPRSREVVLEIARAIRAGNMVLIDGGRAIAGLCFVENLADATMLAMQHDDVRAQAFNVTDGLSVTWRELTDDLAGGLGCRPVRWSMPYPLAEGIGFSLEHGYRALRATTGLSTRPLLSRQAVQVMGRDQSFSNRRAGEVLGWVPRVDYATGLQHTLEWLRSQDLSV
jgi:nucleoside-diphosphate-sugar epimerase